MRVKLTHLPSFQSYFGVTSDLHKKEMKDTLMAYIAKVKKTVEEESAESEHDIRLGANVTFARLTI